MVFISTQDLPHDCHLEGTPIVLIELLLQLCTIGREVTRFDSASAARYIQCIATKKFVALRRDIAEAWNNRRAAHQFLCRLPIACFGYRAYDSSAVDLVHQIV